MKKNLDAQQVEKCQEMFSTWQTESKRLDDEILSMARWIHESVDERGPSNQEASQRLQTLRDFLSGHFTLEENLASRMTNFYDLPHPELDGMRRQSSSDHADLLNKIDDLNNRILELGILPELWPDVKTQIRLLLDLIEQHEERESASLIALLPCEALE